MDQAVPCGLIVNELLTNSLKHAFPTGGAGEVRLGLEVLVGVARVRLHVGDNGVGLPAGFDPTHAATLGLQLVSDLSRQLRGTLEIAAPGHGAGFTLTFAVVRSLPPVG
jgi:two-component sensor histidine kinase